MAERLFQIKICGLSRQSDVAAAVAAGADAIGFNFCPASRRYIEPAVAHELAAEIPSDVLKVGIFVDSPADQVARTAEVAGLDLVQLHGDEPPEFGQRLPSQRFIKAFRFRPDRVREIDAYFQAADPQPAGLLIDAYDPRAHGGTGQVVDWEALAGLSGHLPDLPLILAGGLHPDNVSEAIRIVRPAGVDTASGVESTVGIKDAARINSFITRAKQAFAETAHLD